MKVFLSYIAVLFALAILDGVWLGVVSKNFFRQHIGHLFRADFIWPAIVLFYVLFAAAIVYFVVVPAGGVWTKALLGGFILGVTAYMTYDLVNYATLKDWPFLVVIVDVAWGGFLTAVAAAVGVAIART